MKISNNEQATNTQGWLSTLRGKFVAFGGFLAILFLGIVGRGDWFLILMHFIGRKSENNSHEHLSFLNDWSSEKTNEFLAQYNLQNVHIIAFASFLVSFSTFLPLCGWLHYHYYYKQRDQPEKWKCQTKFLTKENHRHEMMMGCINMAIGGVVSGFIASWIINGGYTTLYFNIDERSWIYLVLSTIMLFVVQDCFAFYAHRSYHHPWLYKRIHKHHHRYHQPTPFSATAMHPIEFLTYQFVLASPAFWLPCYSGSFILCLLYNYYYGVIDHSGIYMESIWPWQPSSMFHDNHHKYFHCNFGFNLKMWDWMHDTLQKEDRLYAEDIFGGRGRSKDVSQKIKSG